LGVAVSIMDSTDEHSHIPIAGRVYRSILGIFGAATALALASASSIEDDDDDDDDDDCPLAISRSTSFSTLTTATSMLELSSSSSSPSPPLRREGLVKAEAGATAAEVLRR